MGKWTELKCDAELLAKIKPMVLQSLERSGTTGKRNKHGQPTRPLSYESFVRGLSSGGLSEQLIVDGFKQQAFEVSLEANKASTSRAKDEEEDDDEDDEGGDYSGIARTQHEFARRYERSRQQRLRVAERQALRARAEADAAEDIDTTDSDEDGMAIDYTAAPRARTSMSPEDYRNMAFSVSDLGAGAGAGGTGPVMAGRSTLFLPGPDDEGQTGSDELARVRTAYERATGRVIRPLPTRSRTQRPVPRQRTAAGQGRAGTSLLSPHTGLLYPGYDGDRPTAGSSVAGTSRVASPSPAEGAVADYVQMQGQLRVEDRGEYLADWEAHQARSATAGPDISRAQITEDATRELHRFLLMQAEQPTHTLPLVNRSAAEEAAALSRLNDFLAEAYRTANGFEARASQQARSEILPLGRVLRHFERMVDTSLKPPTEDNLDELDRVDHTFKPMQEILYDLIAAVGCRAMQRPDWFDIVPEYQRFAAEVGAACAKFLSKTYVGYQPVGDPGQGRITDNGSLEWIEDMQRRLAEYVRTPRAFDSWPSILVDDNENARRATAQRAAGPANAGDATAIWSPQSRGSARIRDPAMIRPAAATTDTDPLSRSALDLLVETRGVRDGVREFIARLNQQDGPVGGTSAA